MVSNAADADITDDIADSNDSILTICSADVEARASASNQMIEQFKGNSVDDDDGQYSILTLMIMR